MSDPVDYANLNDDDLLAMGEPTATGAATPPEADAGSTEPVIETPAPEEDTNPTPAPPEGNPDEDEEEGATPAPAPVVDDAELGKQGEPAPVVPAEQKPAPAAVVENPPADDGATPPVTAPEEEDNFDYKGAYQALLAPFKANGRMIELKSPDDLKSLAQMGANYTKNMQDLAPHRRTLAMLKQANITEDQLSYLIDLSQKKPDAIQKLVHDAGIDPLTLSTDTAPAYVPGNHHVSDKDLAFNTTLEELASDPVGVETLQVLRQWDQASQEAAYNDPQIMRDIHAHRQDGTFEAIDNEVHRLRTLGRIPREVSYVQAYAAIFQQAEADRAAQQQAQAATPPAQVAPPVQAPPAQPVARQPVATRVQAPAPEVVDPRVAAAATGRPANRPAKPDIADTLANLSDEKFLQEMSKLHGQL
ncbi:tail length tape measure protein [Stenotrophomonas phage Philippe]|uniref:Tape measure protein n=1 Tax=Stenotrophomonas phage Philippe TaxID=2859655 RepID=A0AAE8BIJ5_9CAUD|nr:tail length tape measure protein [Stenotrophomonas phage Philippe]QYW02277.1 hypothetical protein CPT_Philippe_084 [Stenotrophomonas phage Philippe]